ncbi:MAG: 4Fe-4S binding protein [Pseudomonadota bacterium]|jgi:pyruvate ferredoxin oxidoreductase delta subunit|nr:4Fe-4S binding protein [Syntrophaceae bacterium]MDI9554781.1 4Fe-4S binding protein [Pseudomonadota bacterium]NLX30753.1 4Fe-4S binding protein [Deltaproteobacteria bacterium]HNU84661.1 4Fe-4S binding protein [Syntrophales bacterium]HNZ33723.1 4Fe-4S binding protein [Syntrophales bacterium]
MAKKKTVQKKWPETWQELNPGCMVFAAGNAANYKTGSWKSQRPVWDNAKCIKCGICYIFCPEGCIQETKDGFYEANLDYCKGCGICAHECWPGAIVMREEEE